MEREAVPVPVSGLKGWVPSHLQPFHVHLSKVTFKTEK